MKFLKFILVPALVAVTVLVAGCMVPASSTISTTSPEAVTSVETAPAIPSLTGTWTGTMKSYDHGTGFNDHANSTMTFAITEQDDRLFKGQLTIIVNGTVVVPAENVAGAISRDGRRFTLAEESGYAFGEIIGDNEMEMIYTNDEPPFSVSIDSLNRS